ncbi:MAG: magnesium chelatase, partial [Bacteroidota bacterium]
THYPKTIDIARSITEQEAAVTEGQQPIRVPELLKVLLERISFEARESEYIDEKSGVSARLSISAYENLLSAAERRMLINGDKKTTARITDFWGIVPAITGKVELVYEGEQEGPYNVAMNLIGSAIKKEFLEIFPNPEKLKRGREKDPFGTIRAWFSGNNSVDLLNDEKEASFKKALDKVAGLRKIVEHEDIKKEDVYTYMELVLHGLAEFNVINKDYIESRFTFHDYLANMLGGFDEE